MWQGTEGMGTKGMVLNPCQDLGDMRGDMFSFVYN